MADATGRGNVGPPGLKSTFVLVDHRLEDRWINDRPIEHQASPSLSDSGWLLSSCDSQSLVCLSPEGTAFHLPVASATGMQFNIILSPEGPTPHNRAWP